MLGLIITVCLCIFMSLLHFPIATTVAYCVFIIMIMFMISQNNILINLLDTVNENSNKILDHIDSVTPICNTLRFDSPNRSSSTSNESNDSNLNEDGVDLEKEFPPGFDYDEFDRMIDEATRNSFGNAEEGDLIFDEETMRKIYDPTYNGDITVYPSNIIRKGSNSNSIGGKTSHKFNNKKTTHKNSNAKKKKKNH